MRRVARASVTALQCTDVDKENQVPPMDRNLNAKANTKVHLNKMVKEGTNKLALKETLANSVETKTGENTGLNNCTAVIVVKGNAKYIANGKLVIAKPQKITKRSKEQRAMLNDISNNPLANAKVAKRDDAIDEDVKDDDAKDEDVRIDVVQPKGQRREEKKIRSLKVHSHKKRKRIHIQRPCSKTEKVSVEGSSEESHIREERLSQGEVIVISDDDDQHLPNSEEMLTGHEQIITSSLLLPKSEGSDKLLPDCKHRFVSDQMLTKLADAGKILPNREHITEDSEEEDDERYDAAPGPRFLHDIDYEDEDDPSFLNEYVLDIYDYMRTLELENPLSKGFLSNQSEITDRMRSVLVDWLVLANYEYKMTQETLFLTVAIIDRYLQKQNTPKNDLQLVGVAAMWIASKYEEVTTVEVAELVHLTESSYTTEQVRQMECAILKALDFQLSIPLQIQFLRRFTKAAGADPFLHAVAKYLVELTIVPYNLAHYPASKVAAAAICLSNALYLSTSNYRQFWNGTMVFHSKYEIEDLTEVIKDLATEALNVGQTRLSAVPKKYATSRLMRASIFVQNKMKVLQNILSESLQ